MPYNIDFSSYNSRFFYNKCLSQSRTNRRSIAMHGFIIADAEIHMPFQYIYYTIIYIYICLPQNPLVHHHVPYKISCLGVYLSTLYIYIHINVSKATVNHHCTMVGSHEHIGSLFWLF